MEKLKNGTRIKNTGRFGGTAKENYFYIDKDSVSDIKYMFPQYERQDGIDATLSVYDLLTYKFEILSEEDEKIDIQSIEEIKFISGDDENAYDNANKINELIRAVKKLDKKIKEEK